MKPQRAALSGKHCSIVYPETTEKGTPETLYREFKRFEHTPSLGHHTRLRQHFKNYYAILVSDFTAYSTLRMCAPMQRRAKEKQTS